MVMQLQIKHHIIYSGGYNYKPSILLHQFVQVGRQQTKLCTLWDNTNRIQYNLINHRCTSCCLPVRLYNLLHSAVYKGLPKASLYITGPVEANLDWSGHAHLYNYKDGYGGGVWGWYVLWSLVSEINTGHACSLHRSIIQVLACLATCHS